MSSEESRTNSVTSAFSFVHIDRLFGAFVLRITVHIMLNSESAKHCAFEAVACDIAMVAKAKEFSDRF
jgi:hypothetical protein